MSEHSSLEEASTLPTSPLPLAEQATVPPGNASPATVGSVIGASGEAGALPRIPGYEILAILGRGGMGVVYKAREEKLQRTVAIKMHLSGAHASAEDLARFRKEAEAVALLQHPNVVQIFHIGEQEGKPFVVLEYVDGGSLAGEIKGKPWNARHAAAMVLQLAQAMAAVHAKGIIHRDLKPANVLLTADFEPKITDFGLAKRLDTETAMTATGAVMGTPNYMAPEQAEGKSKLITPAADVYALGAILYELLTGRPPFVGDTPLDVIVQVVSEEPVSLNSLRAGLPKDLATICHKCLEKEPGKRYPRASALAEDLASFLEGRPIAARPVGRLEQTWRWCRRNPVVAGLIVAVSVSLLAGTVVATLFAMLSARSAEEALRKEAIAVQEKQRADREAETAKQAQQRAKEEAERAQRERNEAHQLLNIQAVQEGLRQVNNGDLLKGLLWFAQPLVSDPDNPTTEAAVNIRLASYRRLFPPPTLRHIFPQVGFVGFSPDGGKILTNNLYGTQVWDTESGRSLGSLQWTDRNTQAKFSPDGRWVAVSNSGAFGPDMGTVQVRDSITGLRRFPSLRHHQQNDPVQVREEDFIRHVEFSADGRWIMTTTQREARIWDATTGQQRSHLKHQEYLTYARFSPDAQLVITSSFSSKAGKAAREVWIWDAATGQRRVCLLSEKEYSVQSAKFSADNRLVLTVGVLDKTPRVWNVATGQPFAFTSPHQGSIKSVSFSPDGRWLATASLDQTARIWEATTGQPRIPALQHDGVVNSVAFSPDGAWLVTTSSDRTARVWAAATGQPRTPPLQHADIVQTGEFSPDGRWVITQQTNGVKGLWNAATGQQHPAQPYLQNSFVAFSPDGRLLVTRGSGYQGLGGNDVETRVWDLTLTQLHPLLKDQTNLRSATFSRDGRWLVTAGDRAARVWDAATGQPRTPPLRHQGFVIHATFSPDGRLVVTTAWDNTKVSRVWDSVTGEPLTPPLQRPESGPISASFSPDSRWLFTVDGIKARLWRIAKERWPFWHPEVDFGFEHWDIRDATFSPDGHWLATLGLQSPRNGILVLWDMETKQKSKTIAVNPICQNMIFSPDCIHVVVAGLGIAQVWNVITGEAHTPVFGERQLDDTYASYSSDGSRILTYGGSHARVWDAKTGLPITPPIQHQGRIRYAEFSKDGRWIVTAGSDPAARVWDAVTGQPLTPPLPHPGGIFQAVFRGNDRQVVTFGGSAIYLWELKDDRPKDDLLQFTQLLAGCKIDSKGGYTPLDTAEKMNLFLRLRTKYPDDFRVPYVPTRQWRQEQLAACLKEGNLAGAFLHRDWLLVEAVREQARAGK
jgi:WD40 repeat protein/tRNA A-37 threonylcarbamoyl transferase component Bud32